MGGTFYHVDGSGELEPGDTMRTEWPPQVQNGVIVKSPEQNESVLKEEYSGGLSRHGARYAQSALTTAESDILNDGWSAMSGMFAYVDIKDGEGGQQRVLPYQVQYEWIFELIRRAEFNQEQSRFQSFFSFQSIEDAKWFRSSHRNSNETIFEVECDNHDVRDMNLIQTPHFGTGLKNAREYWSGQAGSDEPTWEVLMEPPVDVVRKIS